MDEIPTIEDARRYCPLNNKSRGDDQTPLFDDEYDDDICLSDHEQCNFATCSILKEVIRREKK